MNKPKSPALPEKIVCPGGGRWPAAAPDGENALLYAGEIYVTEEVLTPDFAQKLIDAGHIVDAEPKEEPKPEPVKPEAPKVVEEKGN